MLSNPGFVVRFAPILASLALMFSCCYLYDIKPPTPVTPPSATPACKMSFTNPHDGAQLLAGGLVTFSWTSVAHAKFYILGINTPGNSGNPNNYPVSNGASWPVDLGGIGGPGSYTATVQSRDADQNILCQAEIHFTLVIPTSTPTPTRTSPPPPTATFTKQPKGHKAPPPPPTATRQVLK